MQKIITKSIFLSLLLICFSAPAFSKTASNQKNSSQDDIFKSQKIKKGDFYNIQVEPDLEEIQAGITRRLDELNKKKESAVEKRDALKKKLDALNQSVIDSKGKTPASKKKTTKKADPDSKEPEDTKEIENQTENPFSLRQKFLDFCLNLKGTKYVWGGKTPSSGLDCSGLISYGAKQSLDIDLSGNAQNIFDKTQEIPLSEAVPGDLVFFKAKNDSRISHVGIFLGKNEGDNDFGNQNLFLNAASSGPRTGVIISGLNENYWKKTYYSCGRFLSE